MQWVALSGNGRIVAESATKKIDYRCPECFNRVRLRSGPHRHPHFFHLSTHSACRQSGKTQHHLQTQLYIKRNLPSAEAELEVSFPKIRRIADVVWEKKRLIFEVQCSPISEEEVKERILDYESLGYQVIWILHEKRFNRLFLSAAESFLIEKECYFTSINDKGGGNIYDQFRLFRNGRIVFKGWPFKISLIAPYKLEDHFLLDGAPIELLLRKSTRKVGFQGDLFDRLRKAGTKEWDRIKHLEHSFSVKNTFLEHIKRRCHWLKNVYSSFLHALLEKYSL